MKSAIIQLVATNPAWAVGAVAVGAVLAVGVVYSLADKSLDIVKEVVEKAIDNGYSFDSPVARVRAYPQ